MINNNVGEKAYFCCDSCGAEYISEQVAVIEFSRTTASADYGFCPLCDNESQVDYDDND